jgi:hypothetical protein
MSTLNLEEFVVTMSRRGDVRISDSSNHALTIMQGSSRDYMVKLLGEFIFEHMGLDAPETNQQDNV